MLGFGGIPELAGLNVPHLDLLRALPEAERLVTLTGAGGAGTTRLAAQVAAGEVEHRPGGHWSVELAVSDQAQVAELISGGARRARRAVQGPVRSLTQPIPQRRLDRARRR